MQKIEQYTKWMINKALEYFGESAREYENAIIRKQSIEIGPGDFETEDYRYDYLLKTLKSESLIYTLHLTVAQFLYPEFYHMLKKITGQSTTLHLALQMAGEEGVWDYEQLKQGQETLLKYLRVEKRAENFLYTELYADERLVMYLAGENSIAESIKGFAEIFFAGDGMETVYGMDNLIQCVKKKLSYHRTTENPMIFQICGQQGRGRCTILKKIAVEEEENGWIFIRTKQLSVVSKEKLAEKFWLLQREAVFYGLGMCFLDFYWKDVLEFESYLKPFLNRTKILPYPICICTGDKENLVAKMRLSVQKIMFPDITREECILLWNCFSKEYGIPVDYERYGVVYRLNPGEIKKIFQGLQVDYEKGILEKEMDRLIITLARGVLEEPQHGQLCEIRDHISFRDLKLEKKPKEMLENVCAFVTYSHQVYDVWNMEGKFLYGKAVTALLCGPPGTGKTMAAHVLAAELNMPLYRIDLSQVVDKYIGETEKKLEEIFCYAGKSNVILFFDEADSIFGKRTEVKESKDKYANTEVSYILQRIEQYQGVVVLATNLKNNIDEAFMRRMKYVIEFKLPDEETRKKIWEGGFSCEIPLNQIDFDYLAQRVELSGGYIKNIILNAVFLAAKEETVVSMRHIILSTCNEYMKLGKIIMPQDFEKYAYYFME